MKWSLHWPLHAASAAQPEYDAAPSSKAWWIGWLKLLCAWLLCMLLCANVALALAAKLPGAGCRIDSPAVSSEAGSTQTPAESEKHVLQCGSLHEK